MVKHFVRRPSKAVEELRCRSDGHHSSLITHHSILRPALVGADYMNASIPYFGSFVKVILEPRGDFLGGWGLGARDFGLRISDFPVEGVAGG